MPKYNMRYIHLSNSSNSSSSRLQGLRLVVDGGRKEDLFLQMNLPTQEVQGKGNSVPIFLSFEMLKKLLKYAER